MKKGYLAFAQLDPEETLPTNCNIKNFDKTIVNEGLIDGKPMSYWESMAKTVVVNMLVTAAENIDSKSVAGKLARDRLLDLAYSEDQKQTKEIIRASLDWKQGFLSRINQKSTTHG